MVMKEVPSSGNVTFIKWKEVAEDTTIKAFYIETKPSSKYPNQQIHYVETEAGARYGLNGNANLDRMMEEIGQGWWIHLTYNGMDTMENGRFAGKDCHQYKLAYDNDRVHPRFSRDGAAREEVKYKDDESQPEEKQATDKPATKEKETPALVRPGGEKQTAKEPAPPKEKRSIF